MSPGALDGGGHRPLQRSLAAARIAVRTVTFALVFDNDTGSRTANEVTEICKGLIAGAPSL